MGYSTSYHPDMEYFSLGTGGLEILTERFLCYSQMVFELIYKLEAAVQQILAVGYNF